MKYEFKPYSPVVFDDDVSHGWKLTFRVAEDYPTNTPRDIEIVDLGPKAHYKSRLASIDLGEGGAVRMHDMDGRFDPSTSAPCVLDLILYREVEEKPAERTIRGVAYVSEFGEVVTVSPDYIDGEAKNCKAVRCTITLYEPA